MIATRRPSRSALSSVLVSAALLAFATPSTRADAAGAGSRGAGHLASNSFPDRPARVVLSPSALAPRTDLRVAAKLPAGRAVATPPSPNATSFDLFFLGSTYVQLDQRGKRLRVFLDEVFNASELSYSTTTYLEVWAAPALAYFGDGIPSGSVQLASFNFPTLAPRERFLDSSTDWTSFASAQLPDETWNVLLVLTEDVGTSYVDTDYRNNGWNVFGQGAFMTPYGVRATATWRNPYNNQSGTAYPTYLNDEFTFFDFGDPANPEVFVKVLAGNDPNYIQILIGGTTNFEYTVNFTGCGQSLQFKKDPFVTTGYANGAAIPKSACPK